MISLLVKGTKHRLVVAHFATSLRIPPNVLLHGHEALSDVRYCPLLAPRHFANRLILSQVPIQKNSLKLLIVAEEVEVLQVVYPVHECDSSGVVHGLSVCI